MENSAFIWVYLGLLKPSTSCRRYLKSKLGHFRPNYHYRRISQDCMHDKVLAFYISLFQIELLTKKPAQSFLPCMLRPRSPSPSSSSRTSTWRASAPWDANNRRRRSRESRAGHSSSCTGRTTDAGSTGPGRASSSGPPLTLSSTKPPRTTCSIGRRLWRSTGERRARHVQDRKMSKGWESWYC